MKSILHYSEVPGGWCDNCYWYDADRCRTPEQLLARTAHLMEKNWLTRTGWGVFVRRYGAE